MELRYIILCIIGISIMLSSCEENFLERYPLDEISNVDYWKTTSDLELYVNQFYPIAFYVTVSPQYQRMFEDELSSDNVVFVQADLRLMGANVVPAAGGWDYTQIRDLNFFLENYQSVESDFEEYKRYVGEAHFFRAFFYFSIVQEYGDAPLIERTLDPDSEELYLPKAPRNEVIDFIIEDLDKAIEYLPSGIIEGRKRLSLEIAQLFKSRVCLFEGTWEKYHEGGPFEVTDSDPERYLNLAVAAADAVINSGIYSIHSTGSPDKDYFFFGDIDYENNPEVLLWKKYDLDQNLGHSRQFEIAKGLSGGMGLTKSLIEAYLCTDGNPIYMPDGSQNPLYQGDGDLLSVTANRDPRLTQTMFTPGFPMQISGTDTLKFVRPAVDEAANSKNPTGYQICKTLNQDPIHHISSSTAADGFTGWILMRYAEVLLNYAEAKCELGQITQSDIDKTINLLRDRVGIPHLIVSDIQTDPNWSFPTLSPIINEIRRERRVELVLEGFRWYDIARWAAADELIVGKRFIGAKFNDVDYSDLTASDFKLTDDGYFDELRDQIPNGYGFVLGRDYLSPISTEELTLNPSLIQNPSW